MLIGGLEETTAHFVMVRLVHTSRWVTWDEGVLDSAQSCWTQPGTSLSAVPAALGNGSRKGWAVGRGQRRAGDDVSLSVHNHFPHPICPGKQFVLGWCEQCLFAALKSVCDFMFLRV